MQFATVTLIGIALAASACDKADASGKAAESKSEVAKGCPAGATADAQKNFCITVPPGYTLEAPKANPPNTDVYLKPADAKNAQIRVWHRPDESGGDYQAMVGNQDTDTKAAGIKVDSRGKLDGTEGSFTLITDGITQRIHVALKGNKRLIVCEASTFTAPLAAPVVEACKSLKPFPL